MPRYIIKLTIKEKDGWTLQWLNSDGTSNIMFFRTFYDAHMEFERMLKEAEYLLRAELGLEYLGFRITKSKEGIDCEMV